jgi:hypothetical protein
MFATLFSVALFALPALADFTIQTPKGLEACTPAKFSWSGGKAPYDLVIVASDAPCGDILADLGGGHKGTSFTWSNVTLPDDMVGKNVSLSLQDADGDEAWSDGIPYTKTATSCKNTTTTTAPGTSTIPANAEATPASDPSTTTSGGAVAAGAANVGHNPLSGGALTSRQTSGSVLAVSALAALLAFSL